MNKFYLGNGVKVIYKQIPGTMTSFCIGFEAGANSEEDFNLGVAHSLEHILFKGTKTKNEIEINLALDRIFAFNNAMTNFPYVIYYGSCSSFDFKEGFELFSDIIINSSFNKDGFKEEIDVILQECKEWKEDFSQYCEDELFYNSYREKRTKEIIIGKEESIKAITLEELKEFYNKFYVGENCVITIISSLDIDQIRHIVEGFNINKGRYKEINIPGETNNPGVYYKKISGFEGAKIQYIYDIKDLSVKELEALSLFSMYIGEGMSSLLFQEVRNNKGYAYDIYSSVKKEKGIEVFSINTSTSKENINNVIKSIDYVLNKSKKDIKKISSMDVESLKNRLILKREFWLERSVELAKYVTTNEIMFKRGIESLNFKDNLIDIDRELILDVVERVINNASIEVLY